MALELNRAAWEKLLDDDIEWLKANAPNELERQHILQCLEWLRDHKPEDPDRGKALA